MSKANSLYYLVGSMTRSEKKAFKITVKCLKVDPNYLALYKIIEKNKTANIQSIKALFLSEREGCSFDATVKYLYKIILDSILELRKEQDSYFSLLNGILKAKILFEKSLFEECFTLLNKVIEESERLENYYTLLLATRLEIECLLELNFTSIDEKSLLSKHFRISKTLRAIMKINEQSSIYDLLKYRVIYKGNVRSAQQKLELNDLVVSEISIVSSSNLENFEINKLHQLFQANYLISVGDYKSAFRSFSELNSLFENNKHLWNNPPFYYLQTIEGVLDSLRGIRNFEGMKYFVEQLKTLESQSVNFNENVKSLIFLYSLFPSLDRGDYIASMAHLIQNRDLIYNKLHLLSLTRQAELSLYASLVYFINQKYKEAHGFINRFLLLQGRDFFYLPLFRTIRLANLMILYELKDFDLIKNETRSIKRELNATLKGYNIERTMLKFVFNRHVIYNSEKRNALWDEISAEMDVIGDDVFEHQVLKIFDFTAWIESKINKLPLTEIMALR